MMKRKKILRTQEGYVAKNFGEWELNNMSFSDTIFSERELKIWKGQQILKIKITFYENSY